jgi:hypothetical protein
MNRIYPQDLQQFLRRYRFPGGVIRGVRVAHASQKVAAVDFRLTVLEAMKDLGSKPKKVRLRLRIDGVEEYRFQMRPNQPKSRIADARISYLNGLFFLNLDAWALEPGEQPQLFDFRASEVYAAGRELWWEEANGPA